MSRLPNFFIIGAPKAGTTSLYHYLDQHPQVYMSPIKEPHFFAPEIRAENFEPDFRRRIERDNHSLREYLSGPMREKRPTGIVAEWQEYVSLFRNAGDALALGEASVCYLWSPSAPERITCRIPDARVLVMLRDPAERAFSQYLQGLGSGMVCCTFREFIQLNLHHRSGLCCAHYPLLELGLYSEQLRRYRERFGRNVWVGFHEVFRSRPLEVCQEICRFLGVTDKFAFRTEERHREAQVPRLNSLGWLKTSGIWQAAARLTPRGLRPHIRRALIRKPGTTRMDPADRRYLIDYYREDIGKLADLVGRDLDGWLRIRD